MFKNSVSLFLTLSAATQAFAQGAVSLHPKPHHRVAVSAWVEQNLSELVEAYKHFHANPELSFQEFETAAEIARGLIASGYEVTTEVGKTGVVAVLRNGEGPTILIRGDTDALPMVEQTGLPYASEVRVERPNGSAVGAMHACGHDVHISMVLGVGKLMNDLRDHWQGTLVMIAQPAEEIGQGAKAMIADGLFDRFPKPQCCLSMHVIHNLAAGHIGYTSGWAAANVDSVDITIFGRGGHGARPHNAVDPVVVSAHVITGLQTIVSRRLNPIEPGVVTVGSIHGGSKHNIIPPEVKLQLTVRSYSDEVRKLLLDSIRQITADTCKTFQCPKPPIVQIDEKEYTPAAYNDPELTSAAAAIFKEIFGDGKVEESPAGMGGEDFGRYARHLGVPGLQYRVGTIPAETIESIGKDNLPSLHSPFFAPDPEPTLRATIESMGNLALALLQSE